MRVASWGLADQALSSLTNFAVGALVARQLGAAPFGAFSFAFATYLLLLNVGRSLGTEPHAVRYSDTGPERWRAGTARMLGLCLTVGLAAGIAVLPVGLLVDGDVGDAFLALAPLLPGLLLQDGWRFAFFAAGRGRDAFINDLVWVVALVPAFALVLRGPSVLTATLAWGGAATVAAAFGLVQARLLPRPLKAVAWLVEHRDLGPAFLGESMALNGASQLALFAIAGLAGLAAAGAYRAAQVLLGPLRVAYLGLAAVAVPEAVRIGAHSAGRFLLLCRLLALGLCAFAIACTAALAFVPDEWGRLVLRETWDVAAPLVVALGIGVAGTGIQMGAYVGVRALAAAGKSLRSRLFSTVLVLVLTVGGTLLADAQGAAWGFAIGTWIGAAYWWFEFLDEVRARVGDTMDGPLTTQQEPYADTSPA